MTLIDLPEPTITRDRYGRPLITPPGGGKAVPYTRASTLAKALDDNQGLIDWSTCAGIVGAFKRAGLAASWQALIAEHGDPWYSSAESKKRAKDLVKQCKEAGGSSDRADLGTALHKLTELVDLGRPLEHVQPNLAADVEAYRRTMAASGFEVLTDYMEAFVVVDELRVAGSFDLLVRATRDHVRDAFAQDVNGDIYGVIPEGTVLVADKKTGSSLEYSWLAFATQLACYSRGFLYDPATNTRTPLPNVDQASGLIIHIPAGTGTCTLHEVDLEAGWEAAQLSVEVRKWRSRKGLGRAWSAASTAGSTAPNGLSLAVLGTEGDASGARATSASTPSSSSPASAAEWTASTATTPTPSPSSAGGASPAATTSTSADDDARRAEIERRLAAIKAHHDATRSMYRLWKAANAIHNLPTWSDCSQSWHYDLVETMLEQTEREFLLPFDPPPSTPEPLPPEPEQRPAEQLVNPDDVRVLFDKVQALDGDARAFWLQMAASLRAYGEQTGFIYDPRKQPTVRNFNMVRALLAWAPHCDEEALRAGLALVVGDDAVQPAFSTGALLASLTVPEAEALCDVGRGYGSEFVDDSSSGELRLRRVS